LSFITNFVSEHNIDELEEDQKEAKNIMDKYFKKTMRTVEVLMN
jgi:hypothetical protein